MLVVRPVLGHGHPRAKGREGNDFLPLTCDWTKSGLYAAGRIPRQPSFRAARPATPERSPSSTHCRLESDHPRARTSRPACFIPSLALRTNLQVESPHAHVRLDERVARPTCARP